MLGLQAFLQSLSCSWKIKDSSRKHGYLDLLDEQYTTKEKYPKKIQGGFEGFTNHLSISNLGKGERTSGY